MVVAMMMIEAKELDDRGIASKRGASPTWYSRSACGPKEEIETVPRCVLFVLSILRRPPLSSASAYLYTRIHSHRAYAQLHSRTAGGFSLHVGPKPHAYRGGKNKGITEKRKRYVPSSPSSPPGTLPTAVNAFLKPPFLNPPPLRPPAAPSFADEDVVPAAAEDPDSEMGLMPKPPVALEPEDAVPAPALPRSAATCFSSARRARAVAVGSRERCRSSLRRWVSMSLETCVFFLFDGS